MERVAILARVSTLKSEQDESYQKQIAYFKEYIAQHPTLILTKIYAERVSGKSIEKRPVFQEMLQDASNQQFDTLLVKSISRFGRNTLDGLNAIRILQRNNIRVKTVEDAFDSDTCDEFTFTLLISLAQKEIEKMSTRIKWGKSQKAQQNLYNGGDPPFGYIRINHKELAFAKDHRVQVLQKIFHDALQGVGAYRIAKTLNDLSYPTPSQMLNKKNASSSWHPSTVLAILKNPIYAGKLIKRKQETLNVLTGEIKKLKKEEYELVDSPYPSLIDFSSFEALQALLERKAQKKTTSSVHLFSGILQCGACGANFHYKKGKQAYLCGTVNHKGKAFCKGKNHYISEQELLCIIKADLKKLFTEKIHMENIYKQIKELPSIAQETPKQQLTSLNKEIHTLKKQKKQLLDLLLRNIISEDLFQEKQAQLQTLIDTLNQKLSVLQREKREDKTVCSQEGLEDLFIKMLQNIDRQLLLTFINRIIIDTDTLIIEYRFLS